ncbi:hypothetical protein PENSPDRAFT_569691 [Peniophora sp. CONT]|nr:hypothetical protein PENSPDRAFT_569691 [Peniophora sp. CONT]
MSSMQAYLASKYMTGPKADAILSRVEPAKKKKKRKAPTSAAPAAGPGIIQDDDADWAAPIEDDADEAAEAVVAADRAFKKRRTEKGKEGESSGWTTVREPTPPPPEDEAPQVVESEGSGMRAGLMSRKELQKRMARAEAEKKGNEPEMDEMAKETVYRDATGRKIDMAAAKAEAARKKREKEEKDRERKEWGKGVVQREQDEEQRKHLKAIKGTDWRRTRDDEELNARQKDKEIWNDPAAAFLTKKRIKGPRKPEYKGPPPPPNRFGIKPGYRWDGVDRSNGFEKKLFQKQNERRLNKQAAHNWGVEDM